MGDVAVGFASGDVPELNVLRCRSSARRTTSSTKQCRPCGRSSTSSSRRSSASTVGMHWTMPPQNFWLNRPVTQLDDLKGLKVRAWNPEQVEMMKALGGSRGLDHLGRGHSGARAQGHRRRDHVRAFGQRLARLRHRQDRLHGQHDDGPPDHDGQQRRSSPSCRPTCARRCSRRRRSGRRSTSRCPGRRRRRPQEPRRQQGDAGRAVSADDVRRARALMRPMWDQWAKKHGSGRPAAAGRRHQGLRRDVTLLDRRARPAVSRGRRDDSIGWRAPSCRPSIHGRIAGATDRVWSCDFVGLCCSPRGRAHQRRDRDALPRRHLDADRRRVLRLHVHLDEPAGVRLRAAERAVPACRGLVGRTCGRRASAVELFGPRSPACRRARSRPYACC